MRVEIVKRADGTGVLRCIRDDGSVTWQKQTERHAAHFALHDLMHFAVETELGFERGFFGLVNEGWEIEDTTGKGSRGPIPPEAGAVEVIVGLFDSERRCGERWSMDQFREFGGAPVQRLRTEDLDRVRERWQELREQWDAVPVGGALGLHFGNQSVRK